MKSLLISALLFACASSLCAQSKKDKIEEIMKSYHNFNMFDGSVLVAEGEDVVYKGAFGMANREWNIPNATDTKFMIGSVSKPITALLVLIQVQKGLIDLDQTISHYIPEFSKNNGDKITIRQLLSHTSGMPNYDIYQDFFPKMSRQYYTREEYIKLYQDAPLVFEPGKGYYYSSWGYYTLGYIVEKVTGKSYSQAMKDDIFDKIGMNSSGSYAHMQVVNKRASGYDYSLGEYKSADFRDQSNTMGTGDLYSTVEDLFKLHTALSKNTLLNKKLTDEMFKPGIAPANYGFGWFNKNFKYQKDSIASNFHLGMTEGFISFLVRTSSPNRLVVFLCNSSPTDFFGIAGSLMRALDNKPVVVKHPVHKAMATLIATKGAAKAVEAYSAMKKDTAGYYVDWISMDFLANELYNLKRYEDARIIGENNVAEFPNKDLVLLTMAKTYQMLGRKEDAISWYKKLIALGTDNQEGKNRLKELEGN